MLEPEAGTGPSSCRANGANVADTCNVQAGLPALRRDARIALPRMAAVAAVSALSLSTLGCYVPEQAGLVSDESDDAESEMFEVDAAFTTPTGEISIIVRAIEDGVDELSGGLHPDRGHRFIVMDIEAARVSDGGAFNTWAILSSARDGQGFEYGERTRMGALRDGSGVRLRSVGDRARGSVAFEIPEDVSVHDISFEVCIRQPGRPVCGTTVGSARVP